MDYHRYIQQARITLHKFVTTFFFFLGHWADYFSTAVKTDKGMSMLLIERCEGVETKLIKTSYSPSAGTAYVTFDNVRVA